MEDKFRALVYHNGELVASFGFFDSWFKAADFLKSNLQCLMPNAQIATAECHVRDDGEVDEEAPAFF